MTESSSVCEREECGHGEDQEGAHDRRDEHHHMVMELGSRRSEGREGRRDPDIIFRMDQ